MLPDVISVFFVIFLVLLNGFFVAVEFAIVRSHTSKLRNQELLSKRGTHSALRLVHDIDGSLSATQLGITIASLVLGWWGEHVFAKIFLGLFDALGETARVLVSHSIATTCALVIITFLHVVLGELAAKSLAIRFPETTLRVLAPPMLLFYLLLKPVVVALTWCANVILRLFGIRGEVESERHHSSAEIAMLISQSVERGEIDKDEQEMIHGVFGFGDTVAREVMTPRTDLVTVSLDASLDEVLEIIVESGLSRFPVIDENVDDVHGILLAKDVLPFVSKNSQPFSVKKIMRESYFIPETKPIDDLLNEFKVRKLHMAIVLDEHGGVDGVVTLEDLLEEIVGDIFDESDIAEAELIIEESGDIIVHGGMLVADINERFEFTIPEGEYDTIAGFIFSTLGRMPRPRDRILINPAGLIVIGKREIESRLRELSLVSDNPPVGPYLANGDGSNGNGHAAGQQLLLSVEKVSGHRVESVRIQQYAVRDISESASEDTASEPTELVSQKGYK